MANRILVVDDESGSREGLRRLLEAWGYSVDTAASAEQALERIAEISPDAVITDLVMPGIDGLGLLRNLREGYTVPVIVFTGQGSIEQAVEAMSLGAENFLEKPVKPDKLKLLLSKLAERMELLARNREMQVELRERGVFGRLRGVSAQMAEVFREMEQVAPSTLSVLITGESGTGKELVARTLHERSPRAQRPFIPVNCAAIPAALLESEIFGHERGSFTGAIQRKIGCFEMADGGTLFLDEIAEMDRSLQAKLLRVLQEQQFRRVGGTGVIVADVRVLAATNRDPMQAIGEGKLREDLYYRLNVFAIHVPPLREHTGDVPLLARHFAEEYAQKTGAEVPAISLAALERLAAHPWPGNVRELKNAIERAALLSRGEPILPEHLPPAIATAVATPRDLIAAAAAGEEGLATVVLPVGISMEDSERELIRSTLAHTAGNKTQAAKILNISLKTLYNKVKKFNL